MNLFKLTALLAFVIFIQHGYSKDLKGTFSGLVTDRKTEMVVADATVQILNTSLKAGSNGEGVVQIKDVKTGIYTIMAYSSEYDTTVLNNIQIRSGVNNTITIPLRRKSSITDLELINVTADTDLKKSTQTTSVTQLSNFELRNTAGSINDINRVIGTLPSAVSGIGEGFDNNFYVRGGRSAENVFIVDGIEFDNISHFSSIDKSGGGVGFLNPSLIDNLEFYAGGMPASMSSRLSSVSDIHVREGSFTDRKYQVDLNASGLGFSFESPMLKNRMSCLVNTRMVYLKFLESFLDELDGIPFYGDTHMKFTVKPNKNDKFNINFIYAFDNYKEDASRFMGKYQNYRIEPVDEYEKMFTYAGGVNWEHQLHSISAKNSLSFSAVKVDNIDEEIFKNGTPPNPMSPSKKIMTAAVPDTTYMAETFYDSDLAEKEVNKREHISIKNDFSLFLRESDQLDVGVSGKLLRHSMRNQESLNYDEARVTYKIDSTDPLNHTVIFLDTLEEYPGHTKRSFDLDSSITFGEVGAYAQYVWEQSRLRIITGVRGDYYRLSRDYAISPRLALSYSGGDAGIFSFSSGIYYQPHSELNNMLFNYLVPEPDDSLPALNLHELELQRNFQFVLGYEKHFERDNYLSAEIYYKYYDREYAFITPQDLDLMDGNSNHLKKPDGKKRSYGLELMFKKQKYDSFYYSLAYSLFFAENKYTDGKWISDKNEIRNTFSGIIGFNFKKYHGIALRASVMEGRPYNSYNLIGRYNKYAEIDTAQDYYSLRYDPMVSLNLRYSLNIPLSKGNFEFYIDLINMLNLTPTVSKYYSNNQQKWVDETVNGFLPIGGITFDF